MCVKEQLVSAANAIKQNQNYNTYSLCFRIQMSSPLVRNPHNPNPGNWADTKMKLANNPLEVEVLVPYSFKGWWPNTKPMA